MSDDLSPVDRDAMIRTVIGEAGNQGAEGQAAVAHTIMNRVVSGRYGDSPSAVVLAPGQFEPWQTRRQELLNYDPNSPGYQKVGGIVDAVVSGDVPDATNGATHFLNPDVVKQRRGGSLPGWASKPIAKVGAHTFYAPEGKSSATDAIDAINDAIGNVAVPSANREMAFSGDDTDPGSMFRDAGFKVPGGKGSPSLPPAPDNSSSPGIIKSGSMFEDAGFQLPGTTQAPVQPDTSWKDREAQANLAAVQAAQQPPQEAGIVSLARGVEHAIGNASMVGMLKGVGNMVTGAPAAVANVATAPGRVLASDQPSTSQSLIPDAVNLAGVVGTGGIPKIGPQALASKLTAEPGALDVLVNAVGPENVPAAVARMRSNPRLTLADVSEPVRDMAGGLAADPAQAGAQREIIAATKRRRADALEATNDAYTAELGPAPNVPQYVQALADRAKAVGKSAIQPALDNAGLVDTSGVIRSIEDKLQPGVNKLISKTDGLPMSDLQRELAGIKDELVSGDGSQLFDANRLHRIQSDFGDRIYEMSKSASGKERNDASQMRQVNEQLITAIDNASGGAYRPARQQFRTEKEIRGAFDAGFDTLKNRSGVEGALSDSPEAMQQWVAQATPEEIAARRIGTRADLAQKINGVKNGSLAGENLVASDWAQQKLRTLFGAEEANRLIKNMADARDIRTTNNMLQGNSATAARLSGQQALAIPRTLSNPLLGPAIGAGGAAIDYLMNGAGPLALAGAGVGALATGGKVAAQRLALARNAEIAKAAMATGQNKSILSNRLMMHPAVKKAATTASAERNLLLDKLNEPRVKRTTP